MYESEEVQGVSEDHGYMDGSREYNQHNPASLEIVESGAQQQLGGDDEGLELQQEIQTHMNHGAIEDQSNNDENHQNIPVEYQYLPEAYHGNTQYVQHHLVPMQNIQTPSNLSQEQYMRSYHVMYDQMPHIQHQVLHISQPSQAAHPVQPGYGNNNPQQHQQQQQSSSHQSSRQQQQQQATSTSTEEPQPAPPVSSRKKTKTQYPWLEVSGPACLSERQEARLPELANVSKKYKSMRCLYCMKYNPITPWATMRPRKYEMGSLQDHANSAHHLKSEKLRQEALMYPVMVPTVVYQIQDDPTHGMPPTDASGMGAGSSGHLATAGATAAGPATAGTGSQTQQPQQQQQITPIGGITNKPMHKTKRSLAELTRTHATRGSLRPAWLHTEGGLIFSDRQLNDPERPASLVKKYQQMLCTFCAVHSPRSPWAILKPRKFEARLLAEHELSTHHQKSVNASAAGGSSAAASAAATAAVQAAVTNAVATQQQQLAQQHQLSPLQTQHLPSPVVSSTVPPPADAPRYTHQQGATIPIAQQQAIAQQQQHHQHAHQLFMQQQQQRQMEQQEQAVALQRAQELHQYHLLQQHMLNQAAVHHHQQSPPHHYMHTGRSGMGYAPDPQQHHLQQQERHVFAPEEDNRDFPGAYPFHQMASNMMSDMAMASNGGYASEQQRQHQQYLHQHLSSERGAGDGGLPHHLLYEYRGGGGAHAGSGKGEDCSGEVQYPISAAVEELTGPEDANGLQEPPQDYLQQQLQSDELQQQLQATDLQFAQGEGDGEPAAQAEDRECNAVGTYSSMEASFPEAPPQNVDEGQGQHQHQGDRQGQGANNREDGGTLYSTGSSSDH